MSAKERGKKVEEICRLLDIRARNIRKASAKGAFKMTPALKTLLEESDATLGEHVRGLTITLDEIVEAYATRPGGKLTPTEIGEVYKRLTSPKGS